MERPTADFPSVFIISSALPKLRYLHSCPFKGVKGEPGVRGKDGSFSAKVSLKSSIVP